MSGPPLTIAVDRDSVAAGDDAESHAARLTIAASCAVAELIAAARRVCPLAGIQGGRATWIVDTGRAGDGSIAVVAEQWREPGLLVPASATVATLFAATAPVLYFRYWCQADPDVVLAALRTGAALPPRYG